MHTGICGMGYWGKVILRHLLQFEIVSKITIYDPAGFSADLEILLSNSKICCTTTATDITKDPTIVAVFIVTPAETHFPIALNLLQARKHIFIEKPITTRLDELKILLHLAKENGRILYPDHTYLKTAEIKKLKKIIGSDNLLGRPFLYQSNRSNFGRFRSDKSVAWDLAVHDIYIIKHLFSQNPVAISARWIKYDNSYPEIMCNINITYDEGLNASIITSWVSPKKFRDIVIVGSKGSFIYDDCLEHNKLTYYCKAIPNNLNEVVYDTTDIKKQITVEKNDAITDQISYFFTLINSNNLENDEASLSVDVIKTLEAIEYSVRNNGRMYYFIEENDNVNKVP
ncbi:putative dehydrogenase [Pantoea alhagi]|uniref:Gfo/Idh/MocA family protein n=1 Tax=Mixta sp. BE291 TaxID=3158787 RepID=UPI00286659FD|nr:putative dehydrogenase [Pantoea alhagi]